MAGTHRGTCFCGAVEIEVRGTPEEMGPLSAFALWKSENVKVVKGADLLGGFQKTAISDRQFCANCGGHLMTGHPALGVTDVCAAVIPGIDFQPSVHLHYARPCCR